MVKILFICLGNICRSPMAEFVFKDMVRKRGLEDKFIIDSGATSTEAVGEGIHYGTRNKLKAENIEFSEHISRQITAKDYEKYDLLIGMEERNVINIKRIVGHDKSNKIYKLLDFSENPRDIADPWYSGNFDVTYEDIVEGCSKLLEYCVANEL